MRLLAFIAVVMLASCRCSAVKDEPYELLSTAKHNPKERVCRLVKAPVELSGVYCVVFEGPESIKDEGK